MPSSWIQYKQTVHHRYILFIFMVSSVFYDCSPGLAYLGRKEGSPGRLFSGSGANKESADHRIGSEYSDLFGLTGATKTFR